MPSNNRLYLDAGESAPLQASFFAPAESTSQALSTPTSAGKANRWAAAFEPRQTEIRGKYRMIH